MSSFPRRGLCGQERNRNPRTIKEKDERHQFRGYKERGALPSNEQASL